MCEFKIGDKIYKKGEKPIKFTILKIEEIIGGNWHDGFATEHIAELNDAIKQVPNAISSCLGKKTFRTCFPCYIDIKDKTTLRFVLIIRPTTDITYLKETIDIEFPPIILNTF